MHTVVETPAYLRHCREAGFSDEIRLEVVTYLAQRPDAGDVIPGTGGARKLRWAGRGKGKSGGYRIITFFCGDDIPVFLVTIYGKGEKADLTMAERNEARHALNSEVKRYREGLVRGVKGRKKIQ